MSMTPEERESLSAMQQMMARIDERTVSTDKKVDSLCANYVTRDEFQPVKNIAFGLVGIMMITMILALAGLVLKHEPNASASPTHNRQTRSVQP